MKDSELKEIPPPKTNWKRVYLLVMGWFLIFILLMYAFTKLTA